MKALAALLVILAGSLLLAGAAQSAPPAGKLRVGVYDSRAVCIGARDNPAFRQPVDDLRDQLKQAEAAGDTKRAAQIKKRGATMQTLRHMQGFSSAPVDDLLSAIRDKMPEIARQAGVDVIVARVDFQAEGVEVVDVTDAIVKAFNPNEKTLKTVAELKKHKPIGLVEAMMIED